MPAIPSILKIRWRSMDTSRTSCTLSMSGPGANATRAQWWRQSLDVNARASRGSGRRIAAVHQHIGAGHEARGITRQKQSGLGDLFGLTETVEQMLRPGHAACGLHIA